MNGVGGCDAHTNTLAQRGFTNKKTSTGHVHRAQMYHVAPLPQVIDRKALSCSQCGDAFYAERMLHLHERLVHTTVPPIHCLHCEAAFGHMADLNAHLLTEHTKARIHSCGSCSNVSYSTSLQLKRHASASHQGHYSWRK
jgi:hypothetical protein